MYLPMRVMVGEKREGQGYSSARKHQDLDLDLIAGDNLQDDQGNRDQQECQRGEAARARESIYTHGE